MARLVLTVLALVFITCVVADYDSHERGYRRRNMYRNNDYYTASEKTSNDSGAYSDSHERDSHRGNRYRHRKNDNRDDRGHDDEAASEEIDTKAEPGTTEVMLPSGRIAYIKDHKASNNSGAYSDSHERDSQRGNRYRHRKNDNRDDRGHDDEAASEEIDTKAEPGTTEVMLPSGRIAYIKDHDDKMNESSRCGSKSFLLELDPSDKEYKLMAREMQSTIRSHPAIHFSKYNITKIERVINGCLMKLYKMRRELIESESKDLNERMLFYATPHTDEIVANGFDERYASLNGMFGAGLYFTEISSKSNQYALGLQMACPKHKDRRCMICERKMTINRVTLGNIYKVKKARSNIAHAPIGYHSVRGVASPGGLRYDEFVIYRGEQAYPDYVVTYNLIP